jgi:hypothetical protein
MKGRCPTQALYQVMSAKTKVTKTKTALKQETYNLSDLKHDLKSLPVRVCPSRTWRLGLGLTTSIVTNLSTVTIGSNNSKPKL